MTGTIAIVLAGGSIEGFGVLTLYRAKGALPFAGHYRIIDFALSTISNSGIERIGIITQYMPSSLIEHVGIGRAWDLRGYSRSVKIMPPFVGLGQTNWFKGTADAVFKNLNFIEDFDPDNVLIVSGDHVHHMDFNEQIQFHRDRDADLTIVATRLSTEKSARRFGYLNVDDEQRVTFFKEKPKRKVSDLVSVGMYIFKTEVLRKALVENAATGATYNLARDVIENMVPGERVFAFETDSYWKYIQDVEEYYMVNMEILDEQSELRIEEWDILTNLEDRALGYRSPAMIKPGAEVTDSLISPGCVIEGVVKRSILSPGVVVERDAIVEESIIMHDCRILKDARLKRVISDKDVIFNTGCIISPENATKHRNTELPDSVENLCLIGKGAKIGRDIEIGANCQVYPGVNLEIFRGRKFDSAMNIR